MLTFSLLDSKYFPYNSRVKGQGQKRETIMLFATPESTDGLGTSNQTVPEGNALTSILNNLSLTIFITPLFLQNTSDFFPNQ